jgi:hypothetical protein
MLFINVERSETMRKIKEIKEMQEKFLEHARRAAAEDINEFYYSMGILRALEWVRDNPEADIYSETDFSFLCWNFRHDLAKWRAEYKEA